MSLNGHAGGNPGHGQGNSYGPPRQSSTQQKREVKRFLASSETQRRAQVPSATAGTFDLVRQFSILAYFKC
jgi:hypothetical protein